MTKAIFFDRDDTIIKDKSYLHKIEDVEFFSDTLASLKKLSESKFIFFMVTNQSGIGRGYFKASAVHTVYEHINQILKDEGISPFIDMAYCPHTPEDNCLCRKPQTGMLEELAQKHKFTLENSYFVGNSLCDYECGKSYGLKSYLVYNKDLVDHPAYIGSLEKLAEKLTA